MGEFSRRAFKYLTAARVPKIKKELERDLATANTGPEWIARASLTSVTELYSLIQLLAHTEQLRVVWSFGRAAGVELGGVGCRIPQTLESILGKCPGSSPHTKNWPTCPPKRASARPPYPSSSTAAGSVRHWVGTFSLSFRKGGRDLRICATWSPESLELIKTESLRGPSLCNRPFSILKGPVSSPVLLRTFYNGGADVL
ncbi:hypothetical protein GGR52DRAFT_134293 [Hypoxylon sp. FL1284]|nr:hypothetical protein GGR52DRAFT_134293 [Hypoxylon sp. FL1284]